MQASIKADINELKKKVKRQFLDQIPYATAIALKNTVKDIENEEKKEMQLVFQNPTRWTLGSVRRTKYVDKKNLKARVWLEEFGGKGIAAGEYLQAQIHGGKRTPKRFEKLLRNKGLLPSNKFIVPGAILPLDAYGNPKRGIYSQVLSALGAQLDVHQRSKSKTKRQRFFVADINGTHGIWMRLKASSVATHRQAIAPVFLFVRNPSYTKRYDFYGVADRVHKQVFSSHFERAIARAIKTAR